MSSQSGFSKTLRKSLVLIPWAALAAFSLAYFSEAEYPGLLFPIFLPLLLGVYAAHEIFLESPSLPWVWGGYAVLLPFIFLHPARPDLRHGAVLVSEWLMIGGTLFAASLLFSKLHNETLAIKDGIAEVAHGLKSKLKENDFYTAKIKTLKAQIGERKRLAGYAREMGTLLDPALIRQTLIEKTKKLFPDDQVSLRVLTTEDSIDAWVGEHKNSILVKDCGHDKRVINASSKSVIAAPLTVSKKLMGLLRVDSAKPNRFMEADLQQLEVYSSLAILALENAQLFSEVNALATKDGLTGLATHRIFQERLTEELLRAGRYHTAVSLIMVDIDHFKSVNDSYGHLAGDQVLKEMGRILGGRLRPVDFAARYGGEEFCLILPGLSITEARELADSIRREIEGLSIFSAGRNFSITASFGCSVFPQDAQIASQLLRKADERLYKAKSGGRNRVVTE